MQAVQGEREISNPGRNGFKKGFKNIQIRFQKAYLKGAYIDFCLCSSQWRVKKNNEDTHLRKKQSKMRGRLLNPPKPCPL